MPDAIARLRREAERLARPLDPSPELEEEGRLTPRLVAWFDQYDAAARELADDLSPEVLRAAAGGPWGDEMGPRPAWHNLLYLAAIKRERETAPPPTSDEQARRLARGLLLGFQWDLDALETLPREVLTRAVAVVFEEYQRLTENEREEPDTAATMRVGPMEVEDQLRRATS